MHAAVLYVPNASLTIIIQIDKGSGIYLVVDLRPGCFFYRLKLRVQVVVFELIHQHTVQPHARTQLDLQPIL